MRKWKLPLAAACVACVLSLVALRVAWATLGEKITTTILSGPVPLNPINVHSETDSHEVEINTKGMSHVYVVHNTIAPGGHTGWHSHPGISFVSVKSGTATEYHGDDPDEPHVYVAGTGFVEDAGRIHLIRNEGTVNLELMAFQILPLGATRRIDQPQP